MSDDPPPPPPLPTTDDPFALLGVARDVDERDLKRAYARLIKVYRPDRAPVEFGRIQAAFEQARWLVELQPMAPITPLPVAPVAPAAPTAPPLAPITPIPVAPATLARRLAQALVRRAPAEVLAIIDDDAYRAAAEDRLELALLALRALTAMAWHDGPWPQVLARYRALPAHPALDAALTVTEAEVAAAAALTAATGPRLPAALLDLLRQRRAVSAAERAPLIGRLARDLDRDRASYLRAFDDLRQRAPGAADALATVLTLELPRRATESEHLPDQVYQALYRRTQPVEHVGLITLGVGATIVIALSAALGAIGMALSVVLAIAAAVAWSKLDAAYRPHVRRHVAGVLIAYAVPASVLVECLRANPAPPGILHRHVEAIAADRGLALLGLAATMTWSCRLCWQPVIGAPRIDDDRDADRFGPGDGLA